VAGVHGGQQVERFGASDLADEQPVGPHAQGVAHEIPDGDLADAVGRRRTALEADHVRSVETQFGGVLDGDDPLAGWHRRSERVEECGLAGPGGTGHDDVAARPHGPAKQRCHRR
jgi:hypothetical protein